MATALSEVSRLCLAGERGERALHLGVHRQHPAQARPRVCPSPLCAASGKAVAAAAATAKPPAAPKKTIDKAYPGITPEKAEDLYR